MYSSVNTDWNCSLNTLAFSASYVDGKHVLVLRVEIPVSSPCMTPIYHKNDLGLSFRLAATI